MHIDINLEFIQLYANNFSKLYATTHAIILTYTYPYLPILAKENNPIVNQKSLFSLINSTCQ